MKLSRYSDYALRVCIYLAARPERVVPISEILEVYRIPRSNVMKLATDLVGAGVLTSTRGRAGGLRLARGASEISVGEVVRRTEGLQPMVDCTTCILAGSCGLVCILAEARTAFFASLDAYSLADVVARSPGAFAHVLSTDDPSTNQP